MAKQLTEELKVAAKSDPRSVGSAVAHHVSEGKRVVLRAIGAGAINQAIKAVAISTQWLGPQGIEIAVRPGFIDLPGREGKAISGLTLEVLVLS